MQPPDKQGRRTYTKAQAQVKPQVRQPVQGKSVPAPSQNSVVQNGVAKRQGPSLPYLEEKYGPTIGWRAAMAEGLADQLDGLLPNKDDRYDTHALAVKYARVVAAKRAAAARQEAANRRRVEVMASAQWRGRHE